MRTRWTEEKLITELRPLCDALGRFPTASELKAWKRHDLQCAITSRGGYVQWAEKLGTTRVYSDSDFGWDGEKKCSEILISNGFIVEETDSVKSPYDRLVNGVVRVDVKTAKYAEYGMRDHKCRGWFFRLGKTVQSDVVILFQADTLNMHILPWTVCPTSSITITTTGRRYEKFLNNFRLLMELAERRQEETRAFMV